MLEQELPVELLDYLSEWLKLMKYYSSK
jgi:hypothetical protein